MIVRELLLQAANTLKEAGCDTPRLDAELLLMHVWQIDKTALIIRMLDDVPGEIENSFQKLLERRQTREPIAYITGEKEFWSRPFRVTPDVLIPRPETEHLIEALLKQLPDTDKNYRFCDIGTGSGCIACTIACEYPNATIVATDISEAALHIAEENAERLNVADRITFKRGDLYAALDGHTETFDAILSNPPYVSSDEMNTLEKELDFEPRHALTDEEDGLKHLSTLLYECGAWLKEEGLIMVETGPCGLPDTPPFLRSIEVFTDLAGMKRGGIYKHNPI
jgi:release factor glutamine methyltransferase